MPSSLPRLPGLVAGLLLCAGLPATAQEPVQSPADLILRNGQIRTPEGWARAIAIRQGVIVAVGDESAVTGLRAASTRVIDLGGATVLPGFHDLHVHPLSAGLGQTECRFPQGSNADTVVATIKACVAQHAAGQWITGGQWDASSFGRIPVHRSLLDKVAPDNPVLLSDISFHSVWVNSRALKLAGIDRNTPNPPGGIIERDRRGEPTGVLRESAAGLVRAIVPPSTAAQNDAALAWSMETMLAQGITSFTDALADETTLQSYARLADAGKLKQRIRACQIWRPSERPLAEQATQFLFQRNTFARERFSPDCIKVALDGVPTDGHTAAMLEPYADVHDHNDPRARGILMVAPEQLKAGLVAFDARGFIVKMHVVGDAAVRAGIDAIAAARAANGNSVLRHELAHNSFVAKEDLRRAAQVSATLEMSPYIWFPNPIIPDITKTVGPARMARFTPVKGAIDSGALVVPGSDWSVVPTVNPWIAMETLVTRQRPGGGGDTVGAEERITLEQAYTLFTENAARQMGAAGRTGRIERGLLADLIVLDRNPFRIPITEVHQTQVTKVLINGEIVRDAAAPAR